MASDADFADSRSRFARLLHVSCTNPVIVMVYLTQDLQVALNTNLQCYPVPVTERWGGSRSLSISPFDLGAGRLQASTLRPL